MQLEFLHVRRGFLDNFTEWIRNLSAPPPDLFLIDHNYNNRTANLDGATISVLLRNAFPTTPRIGVTGQNIRKISHEAGEEYLKVYDKIKIPSVFEELAAIIEGYRLFSNFSNTDIFEFLVRVLDPPVSEKDSLQKLIPNEFRDQIHRTTPHRIVLRRHDTSDIYAP